MFRAMPVTVLIAFIHVYCTIKYDVHYSNFSSIAAVVRNFTI